PLRRTAPGAAAPPPPRQTTAMPAASQPPRQAVPLRPLAQPQGAPLPPPPRAPATAPTLFGDLPVTAERMEPHSAAATHRGLGRQAPTLRALGLLLELDEPAAASTARGFAPPVQSP